MFLASVGYMWDLFDNWEHDQDSFYGFGWTVDCRGDHQGTPWALNDLVVETSGSRLGKKYHWIVCVLNHLTKLNRFSNPEAWAKSLYEFLKGPAAALASGDDVAVSCISACLQREWP